MPDPTPRDFWFKFDVIAKVATPAVLALASIMFGLFQWKNSQNQLQAERVEKMLVHLASENPKERLLAVVVVDHFVRNKQFPAELYPAIDLTASTDQNKEVANAASGVVQAVAAQTQDTALAEAARASLTTFKPRVYIHILDAVRQRQAAETIKTKLEDAGYDVPAFETVSVAIKGNNIRYLRSEDAANAQKIASLLSQAGLGSFQVKDLSSFVNAKKVAVRPNTYELWLANQ